MKIWSYNKKLEFNKVKISFGFGGNNEDFHIGLGMSINIVYRIFDNIFC